MIGLLLFYLQLYGDTFDPSESQPEHAFGFCA